MQSLISVAFITFFKDGNTIIFVQPIACSVKIHGLVLLLRAITSCAVFGTATAAYNKLINKDKKQLAVFVPQHFSQQFQAH